MRPRDIINAVKKAEDNFRCNDLNGYRAANAQGFLGNVRSYAGTYGISFPLEAPGEPTICLRLWLNDNALRKNEKQGSGVYLKQIKDVSNYFNRHSGIKYVVGYKYVDKTISVDGIDRPGIIMRWVDGSTLIEYIKQNRRYKSKIQALAREFYSMSEYFKQYGMAHGDLSSANIIVNKSGQLFLIDYDSFYIRGCTDEGISASTNGTDGYQHPSRGNGYCLNEAMDNFSQQVIYLTLLAIAEKPDLSDKITDNQLFFDKNIFDKLRSLSDKEVMALLSKNNSNDGVLGIFSKLSAIDNDEVTARLNEFVKAIRGPLEDVRSIVDFEMPGKSVAKNNLVEYCIMCGLKFPNKTDAYCTRCGTQRYRYQ